MGIGAGLIVDGRIYSGSNCNAGELSGIITNAEDGSMYSTFCAKKRSENSAAGVLSGVKFFYRRI